MMTDKPILFSGPMVRAILEGRKTQTRRALKPQPCSTSLFVQTAAGTTYDAGKGRPFGRIPYAPGDRLWVREAWQARGLNWGKKPRDMQPAYGNVHYAATDDGKWLTYWGAWKPSIHMPRWASRLTLTVTDVRVQRVHEISEGDAKAEGCEDDPMYPELGTAVHAFQDLWDSLNAKRGYGWDESPWVCAVTFTAHRCNIDQMENS